MNQQGASLINYLLCLLFICLGGITAINYKLKSIKQDAETFKQYQCVQDYQKVTDDMVTFLVRTNQLIIAGEAAKFTMRVFFPQLSVILPAAEQLFDKGIASAQQIAFSAYMFNIAQSLMQRCHFVPLNIQVTPIRNKLGILRRHRLFKTALFSHRPIKLLFPHLSNRNLNLITTARIKQGSYSQSTRMLIQL